MTKEDKAFKEDLVRLRDTEQNSWANVAAALSLGSPGAARRAYSVLVRLHTDSVLDGRPQGEGRVSPVDLADADLDTLRETVAGHRIVVQRKDSTETIKVARVTSLKWARSTSTTATRAAPSSWRPSSPSSSSTQQPRAPGSLNRAGGS